MKKLIAVWRAVLALVTPTTTGWISCSVQSPQPGWIVKRWNSGTVWAGYFNGDAKMASCDYWLPIPDVSKGD